MYILWFSTNSQGNGGSISSRNFITFWNTMVSGLTWTNLQISLTEMSTDVLEILSTVHPMFHVRILRNVIKFITEKQSSNIMIYFFSNFWRYSVVLHPLCGQCPSCWSSLWCSFSVWVVPIRTDANVNNTLELLNPYASRFLTWKLLQRYSGRDREACISIVKVYINDFLNVLELTRYLTSNN